jgi:SAM-dependent methyltransferase
MISKLKAIHFRQMFFPGIFAIFVNPYYLARRDLCLAMINLSHELTGSLLDVGCGAKPYRNLFSVDSYKGLDIDSPIVRERGIADDFYDGNVFPYTNSTFDSILCNQVLEHVFNPAEFLQEVNRVLKPGGKLLLTVPFVWDEHEQPYDYARYSSFGLRALLEKSGFLIQQHKKLGADATVLFQLANAYLFKVTQSWPTLAKLIFLTTVMAMINVLGMIAGRVLPGNPDLYLDHVVLAEKIS